jgi:hypothetical protein
MKEQGHVTWIEQRIAELEGNLAVSRAEMQSLFASGTVPDPQVLGRIESWEKELEGLKSLREIREDPEEA